MSDPHESLSRRVLAVVAAGLLLVGCRSASAAEHDLAPWLRAHAADWGLGPTVVPVSEPDVVSLAMGLRILATIDGQPDRAPAVAEAVHDVLDHPQQYSQEDREQLSSDLGAIEAATDGRWIAGAAIRDLSRGGGDDAPSDDADGTGGPCRQFTELVAAAADDVAVQDALIRAQRMDDRRPCRLGDNGRDALVRSAVEYRERLAADEADVVGLRDRIALLRALGLDDPAAERVVADAQTLAEEQLTAAEDEGQSLLPSAAAFDLMSLLDIAGHAWPDATERWPAVVAKIELWVSSGASIPGSNWEDVYGRLLNAYVFQRTRAVSVRPGDAAAVWDLTTVHDDDPPLSVALAAAVAAAREPDGDTCAALADDVEAVLPGVRRRPRATVARGTSDVIELWVREALVACGDDDAKASGRSPAQELTRDAHASVYLRWMMVELACADDGARLEDRLRTDAGSDARQAVESWSSGASTGYGSVYEVFAALRIIELVEADCDAPGVIESAVNGWG